MSARSKRRSQRRAALHAEPLEGRRLLAFAKPDAGFGNGGTVLLTAAGDYGDIFAHPLADGRVVVIEHSDIRYLRGDGNLDTKRGSGGVRSLGDPSAVVASAVDATGRAVVIRLVNGVAGQDYLLELFDVKGRSVATSILPGAGRVIREKGVAFAPDGGVVVALSTVPPSGDMNPSYAAEIRKFSATLVPDASYGGGGGVASAVYSAPTDSYDGGARVGGVDVDSLGRAYVVTYDASYTHSDASQTSEFDLRALRFNAAGVADATYNGPAGRLLSDDNYSQADLNSVFADFALRADGTLYSLFGDPSDHLILIHTSPNAADANVEATITGPGLSGLPTRSARLAIGSDGLGHSAVYVTVTTHVIGANVSEDRLASSGVTQLYQRDDVTLQATPGVSDFGEYLTTTSDVGVVNPSVDSAGRVYLAGAGADLTGRRIAAVSAVKGNATDFTSVPQGTARLQPDGTLVVRGTGKADKITFLGKQRRYYVYVNDRVYNLDRGANVRGLLVLAGGGDDALAFQHWSASVYAEGGGGNDSLISASGNDTLLGGAGNDILRSGENQDFLYGQDGNDTLYGSRSPDVLFGGRGNDYLAASDDTEPTEFEDLRRNLLYGGAGKDTFRLDLDHDSALDAVTGDKVIDFVPA